MCDKKYYRRIDLSRHMNTSHDIEEENETEVIKIPTFIVEEHIHTCSACGKNFKSNLELALHHRKLKRNQLNLHRMKNLVYKILFVIFF